MISDSTLRHPTALILLMAVQLACAVFFVTDAVQDFIESGPGSVDGHLVIEALATLSLLLAIALEGRILTSLRRREADLEEHLTNASAEVHAVIMAQFDAWSLSPSERDIATFLVKGLSTQEIAEMRGNAEGTVKVHFNAIFRKAGVHSRVELLSLIIDRLLGSRLDSSGG